MNIIEIQEKIQEEENRLSSILEEENDYIIFLKTFLENNRFSGVYNIENINIPDFFTSYILYKCRDLTYEKVRDIVYRSRRVFQESSLLMNFEDGLGKLFTIATTDIYDTYKELASDDNLMVTLFEFLTNKNLKSELDLITLIHDHPEEATETISLIYNIINLKKHNMGVQLVTCMDLNAKENRKLKRHNEHKINTSNFDSYVSKFVDYCNDTISSERSRKKQAKKEILALRNVDSWLNKVGSKEGKISSNEKVYKITNKELRTFILKQIYSHNLLICEEKQQEYQKLLKNSKNNYKMILKKHNIFMEDEEIAFKIDVDDLECCFEILEKLGIKDTDTVVQILKTTTKERIENLNSYIGSGYLEKSVLINFPSLFDCKEDNSLFDNLSSNIDLLKSKNISTTIIGNMNTIILFGTSYLKKSLEVLDSYGYTPFLKNSSSYTFLLSNDLEQKLNIMIELGFSSNLETDLSLLEYSSDDYKKLVILKEMNLLPDENNELFNALNKDFGKNRIDLDEYIFDMKRFAEFENNNVLSKNEFLQKLDDNDVEKSDLRCYHIGDVLISRVKVQEELDRITSDNLTTTEQFEILTKDKILNNNEYQKIIGLLDSKKAESSMVKIK